MAGSHERDRLAATFHMFCKWHRIPVDAEGFLDAKEEGIRRDLKTSEYSLESSALLSHSLVELNDRFDARFLLLIRNPAATVASFAVRNWFVNTPVRNNPNLPPTFRGHEGEKARHFLGRILPNGDEFRRWSALTPIGRIAWFWRARNEAILNQFSELPRHHCRVQRLEEFSPSSYFKVAAHFGWRPAITEKQISELATAKPNHGPNQPRTVHDWSEREIAEFEAEVGPLADRMGYEFRAEALIGSANTLRDDVPSLEVLLGE